MKHLPKLNCETCTSRNESVFNTLCTEGLAKLSNSKTCNVYKKGQIVFYEGNSPTGLFCINKGKVKVYKQGKAGKEQIVRLAKSGDILGYRALIGENVYSASAEALEDATICFLDKKIFFDILQNDTEMPLKIMRVLCAELGDAENSIQSISQKTVRERLAEVLLLLKKKYGMDETDANQLGISLSREDLANMVGTATETIIRLLSDFKDEKILSFEGRKIKFVNLKKIIAVSGIEY